MSVNFIVLHSGEDGRVTSIILSLIRKERTIAYVRA